ncbi:hypothetical protein ILUMI_18862 [Ignelater luminosus]|uniref:Uncharacterized protein n=1 Tax=Ignelater luminosus TaxID=2038154 RepID=A0A8K0G649_IGNLU|nr:hypothetical protein ILUMI_18862 [Ignelater luminosus]
MLLLNLVTLMSVLIISAPLPLENSKSAKSKILEYTFDSDGSGNYEYGYETDDNIVRVEKGEIVKDGEHNASLVVRGSYSYVGKDGEKIEVVYVADDKGFHPVIVYTFNATANDNKPDKKSHKVTDEKSSSKAKTH